jgi:DNA-binding MarR family transcriptional regulator
MTSRLADQAMLLHQAVVHLAKRYQFRDRNHTCAYGISVSQCYALEALYTHETLNMNALATELGVTVSSASRIVDQLVAKGFVQRQTSQSDRRVCKVHATDAGRQLVDNILSGLLTREQDILQRIPTASRDHVIWAIQQLSVTADDWRQTVPQA